MSRANPRKWRYTWETQSHMSTLKLYLYNPNTNPSVLCNNRLNAALFLDQSLLHVSWFESQKQVSIRVPVPRVLIDFESPVISKALDDHIEVRLSLLLPIDHPMTHSLDSLLNNLSLDFDDSCSDDLKPLFMDSDIESLSSSTGGVHFYCRSCSTKLTTSLRLFEEMPSVNWSEVADNWFGNCCCSFGGISEKLVTGYAKSYTSTPGVCLVNTTSVVICKDDLVGCTILESELDSGSNNCLNRGNGSICERTASVNGQAKEMHGFDRQLSSTCLSDVKLESAAEHDVLIVDTISHKSQTSEDRENVVVLLSQDVHTSVDIHGHADAKCCTLGASESSAMDQETKFVELLENQKSFLNGYLGDVFMTRSSNVSKDVHWIELLCPQCSCLLGAYPCDNDNVPFDSGVHLFKCYVSSCLDVGVSCNLFRKYTLERMFANLLLGSAKDELSFRTVVRDLHTKKPMLQIVLLNPNLWCCSGYCVNHVEQVPKISLYPSIKLLFSDCSKSDECQSRMVEEWTAKNQADEVHMLTSQIKELIGSLELITNILPPSHTLLPGFSLSSMRR